jgi:DNA mismatch endonuclease (patch repair protein)
MSRVRSKNTKPEVSVRRALHAAGYRFRLHRKDLPGKPDIVLPKYRIAVFVNGYFWHGHGCKRSKLPATNTEFWRGKVARNTTRDQEAQRQLAEIGWHVHIIWTCSTKHGLEQLMQLLQGRKPGIPV